MPKSCSAYNCTNRYSNTNPDITFHRFPLSKPSILKQWLDNIGRDGFHPRKHMVICSLHFTPDCFSGVGNRTNLLWNAVPTLFTIPTHDTKQRRSRKRQKKFHPALSELHGFAPQWMISVRDHNQSENMQALSLPTSVEHHADLHGFYLHHTTPKDFDVSDHTYALTDPCSAKAHLLDALEMNRWLRKRLKNKFQEIKVIKRRLQAAQRQLMTLRCWRDFSLMWRQRHLRFSVIKDKFKRPMANLKCHSTQVKMFKDSVCGRTDNDF
ncbi:THAP domain-containing protein 3 [Brachyhypopomus gauderio]|uniref:THAP domain-containing protein 3 n=1 Tax=Brachyhypopomus gauderio TaxID=698409 RepID=UPI00404172C0